MKILDSKLNFVITSLLLNLGVQANLNGFKYLRDIIYYALKNPKNLDDTMLLYSVAAKQHSASPKCVERCIRHSIDKLWSAHAHEVTDFFNWKYGKPKNTEFIIAVANHIYLSMDIAI